MLPAEEAPNVVGYQVHGGYEQQGNRCCQKQTPPKRKSHGSHIRIRTTHAVGQRKQSDHRSQSGKDYRTQPIGESIESHMKMIGMIKDDTISDHQQNIMNEKRAEYEKKHTNTEQSAEDTTASFPAGSQLCKKCNTKATILMDGCMTCLNCGESKCG